MLISIASKAIKTTMILIFGAVIIILIIILIFEYFEIIKDYVRCWNLLNKLPAASGKGLFYTGHVLKHIGIQKGKKF